MALNAIYDTKEEIPERFQELYTERDGKWELTGITGIKTQADIDRLTTSIEKERDKTKAVREKLEAFGELDPVQVTKDMDELKEARVRLEQGEGQIDDEKVERLVEARVATQTAPIKRELDQSQTDGADLQAKVEMYQKRETTRTVTDSVRDAAVDIKIISTAMDDVLMLGERVFEVTEDGSVLTRDMVGCTPGIAPDIWLAEMMEKRPHWWPASAGSGAAGSGNGQAFGNNPFSNAHWSMTLQGNAYRENSQRAEQMAKAAGTTIGGPRPIPAQGQ